MKKNFILLVILLLATSIVSCNNSESKLSKTVNNQSINSISKENINTKLTLTTEDGTPVSPTMTPEKTKNGYIYKSLNKRGEIYFDIGKDQLVKTINDEYLKDILKDIDNIELIENNSSFNGNYITLEFLEDNWNYGIKFKIYENDAVEFLFPKINGKFKFTKDKLKYKNLVEYYNKSKVK